MHSNCGSFQGVSIYGEYDPWHIDAWVLMARVGDVYVERIAKRRHRARKRLVKDIARELQRQRR